MSISPAAIWAAAPSTARGAQATPLSSDSKGERIAYASGKSIFVRNIDDPSVSRQYTNHQSATTVARFSPSGFYVASGDTAGNVKVWDCIGEGSTKGDYHIIAGRINDLAWDGDSQRIIAVGDGKERFGHCITWDSGNTVGEISGHSSQVNCVAIRQQRPLRAATGSDDTSMVFYHGAPFKFNTSLREKHDRYVFGTAFSPDGTHLVTVGADKRIWVYDGKTGEAKKQVGEGVHTGSIFGVSWSSDSKRFVTASADQTVRIWDVESGENVHTWRLGEEGVVSIAHQQVGVTWPAGRSDDLIITVDLDGNLNYLVESSEKPIKVVPGHAKNITAAGVCGDKFFTGSYDGKVLEWDIGTGTAATVDGESHTSYVAGFRGSSGGAEPRMYSVGWDDTLRTISVNTKAFVGSSLKLGFQPKGVATSGNSVLVASSDAVTIYEEGQQVGSLQMAHGPTTIAAHDSLVAVGSEDNVVRLFEFANNTLKDLNISLTNAVAAISSLAFSPKGTYLAAGNSSGRIYVYSGKTGEWKLETDRWSAHTARVTAVAWSASEEFAVSGSLDTSVYVWSLANPGRRVKALAAHKDGVNGVAFVADDKVLSTGADAAVKVWKLEGLE
ncbi:WD repeat-containing protein 2 [Phyllosticta capitalensis]|uniref:WD repeat-containing protein 2 n=1 Tax=Phyllosticta capitalensis TaxID=121624 RepID=A0ABR1YE12_9PEZI